MIDPVTRNIVYKLRDKGYYAFGQEDRDRTADHINTMESRIEELEDKIVLMEVSNINRDDYIKELEERLIDLEPVPFLHQIKEKDDE